MRFSLPNGIPENRRKIIESILTEVVNKNSGEEISEIFESRPSRKFFIGTLSPRPTKNELEVLTNKVAPPTIGLEFLISKDYKTSSKISILPQGALYYRVFPEYEKQLKFSSKVTAEGQKSSQLLEDYKKIKFDFQPFTIKISEVIEQCKKQGEFIIELDEIINLWNKVKKNPDFYKMKKKGRWKKYPRIPFEALESKSEYNRYIFSDLENPPDCPWNGEIRIEVFETQDGWRFIVSFSNLSEYNEDPSIENTIFEASLKVNLLEEDFKKFKLDYLEENYRHDRLIEASGINCSYRLNSKNQVETLHLPIYYEKRIVPVDCNINLNFEELSKEPHEILNKVEKFLIQRLSIFKKKYEGIVKTAIEKESFSSDVEMIERELLRFQNGVKVLKENNECLRAFKLMNKSFLYASKVSKKKKFTTWYPFQLVFIVSLIPDIIHTYFPQEINYRDRVDLLYYPTGGGKTEAFLGLAVFQAFLDRIMGKSYGVSVITKFPLRMLSLQQLQRIANIFAQAELVRIEEKDLSSPISEFSVGYLVGEASTPNELIPYDAIKGKYYDLLAELESDKKLLEKYQIVTQCPYCQKRTIELKINRERRRILHICSNKECKKELPIYISDWEIYRHLPTFIVGTLDKLVSVGMQIKFRNILGGIKYKCPKHGFSSTQKCIESGSKSYPICTIGPVEMEPVPEGDYSPSLIIQDEMHLVRDTWGTFNSHYETLFDKLIFELSNKKKLVKKIAATATISPSTYTEHVYDLYVRKPILFPSNLELFTQESDNIARVIVGIMPHGKTHIDAMEDVVGSIAVTIQQSINNNSFSLDDARQFWTILSYHNKRNDAYQMGRSVGTRINENKLRPIGLKELKKETLTGEISFKDIRRIMDSIESEKNYNKIIDTLIATSIISHGIDINSLNLMAFMGMPPNNAEYIQALSRIGRRSTGLAFIVFNPTRERDQSYFKYFLKFNELRDLLVESIPICRWSQRAIERTCSGVFMASLLCHFDYIARKKGTYGELRFVEPFKKALNDRAFDVDEIIDFVKLCYQPEKSPFPNEISKLIEDNVSRHINSILSGTSHSSKREYIGYSLVPKPLSSLRDIDASVSIALESDTYSALKTGMIYCAREEGE